MSSNRVVGGFEDSFERASGAVTSAAKQTIKDFTNTTKGQITGSQGSPQAPNDHGSNEHGVSANTPTPKVTDKGSNDHGNTDSGSGNDGMTDDERKDFLSKLYGGSEKKPEPEKKQGASVSDVLGITQKDPNKGKSPEDIAKMNALRQRLHSVKYYQPLVNRPKPQEEPVADKLEREEQEAKFDELEKQKKKPAPLPATVKQGTGESVVGVSG